MRCSDHGGESQIYTADVLWSRAVHPAREGIANNRPKRFPSFRQIYDKGDAELNLFPIIVSIGNKYSAIGGERSCDQPSPKYAFSFLSFSPSLLAPPWSIPVLHAHGLTMQCGFMTIGDLMVIGCQATRQSGNSLLSPGACQKAGPLFA